MVITQKKQEFKPITILLETEEEAAWLMELAGSVMHNVHCPQDTFYQDIFSTLLKLGIEHSDNLQGSIRFRN